MTNRLVNYAKIIIVVALVMTAFTWYIDIEKNADYTYTVSSEKYVSEGRHYEYYTKTKGECISKTENVCYVEVKGQIYSFYITSDSEIDVNDKLIITFNEAREIVDIDFAD